MKKDDQEKKPWGGRFSQPTDALVEEFSASVSVDKRLYRHDIRASIAHATMLAKVGVLTPEERDAIVDGLEGIRKDIEDGRFAWRTELEDVHMNIEASLVERIGPTGKKLHTARSRNDQVATDMRLYLRDEIDLIVEGIKTLQAELVEVAEREAATIMPGFTHLQTAQPITLGHHLLAWFEMLRRDRSRLSECRKRLNVMPLGSAALAGTSYPIDRAFTAQMLGFEELSENSLDAVSDRDFIVEFLAAASLTMIHFSRIAEELVMWSSPQFAFIELPDAFCTGSSIMPQKKNPDVPELARGKTGRVCGHLVSMLMLMKAQPLAYNRDNQEDKVPLFDSIDTLKATVDVFARLLPGIVFKRNTMAAAAGSGYSTATDLADHLVRRGVPFRDAHEIVGRAVGQAIAEGKELKDLPVAQLQRLSAIIDATVLETLSVEGSVQARNHIGGTAPEQVRAAAKRARASL